MYPADESDWLERARYTATFASRAWPGLEQVAADLRGQVVSFALERHGEEVHAEARIAAPIGDKRYRMALWPNPVKHPAELAAILFVTAVEERLQAPGFHNPPVQLAMAADRVAKRRELTQGGTDRRLASALYSHAAILARYDRAGEALPLATEAIGHYVHLVEQDPGMYAESLAQVEAVKDACLRQLDRDDNRD